jgi:hypothetical protein
MKVLVENIQQLLIKINNPNTEPEYSLTKTCYGQAADVCVTLSLVGGHRLFLKAIALPFQLQPLKGQCYAGTNWMVRADILGKQKLTRVMKESHNQLLPNGTTKYMNLHLPPLVALKNRRMFHG